MGATELRLRADGSTWAQRHYGSGSLSVAVRSNESGANELSYLVTDHHGTATLAIDATNQEFSRRYTTPFGAPRGDTTGAAWPDDKGFLGKTTDTGTGLTHVDARQHDPEIGQFISVDPLLQTGVGQTLNGYSYAVQNPSTLADPSGLGVPECREPQKYGITCRGGIPVSSGKKKTSSGSGEGPVRACRCGGRPTLVKGMKPTGLGGIPGRRNITLPSTPPPTGWLKVVPPPNPGPAPKAEANKNWFQRAVDSFNSTQGGVKQKLMGAAFGAMGMDNSRGACASLGGGLFVSVEGSACIVMTKKPDGAVDFGWTRSVSVGGAGFGFSGDVSMLRSNADDIGQFAGYGRDVGASFFSGVGGTINHEHAIGTYNSKGEQVRSFEMGFGAGLEYEGYAGVNKTWNGTWFTR